LFYDTEGNLVGLRQPVRAVSETLYGPPSNVVHGRYSFVAFGRASRSPLPLSLVIVRGVPLERVVAG
jgi:hypothetical protein